MAAFILTPPDPSEILDMLSIAKMKENLRISYGNEDDFIRDCILEAYDHMAGEKGWLNRSVITTTWVLRAPAFAANFELPKPPAVAIGSVKYLASGTLQTLSAPNYYLQTNGTFGFGYLTPSGSWPTGLDQNPDAVEITYTAGYGTGEEVREKHPALVKAMKLLAADYFRHREDTFTDIRMVEIDRSVVNNAKVVAGRYKLYNRIA